MVACGIWGARNTAVVFDIRSLLPEGSYLMDWIDRNEVDFPVDGFGFGVDFYTEDLEYREAHQVVGYHLLTRIYKLRHSITMFFLRPNF